jgi:haloalkane dehalogenase
MRAVRTPESRVAAVPDFPYEPQYADVGGLRMAYVTAGPPDGEPVLLLHGEPSWSFLYRTVMAVLAGAGLRAIAPDLIGFGRSDKPADIADHTYARHVEWMRALAFDRLGLRGLTLVGQDWGGLIGLRLVAEHPGRFARVVAANTGLPTGDHPMPDVWLRFREVVATAAGLTVSRLVQSGCQRALPEEVLAAYDAPFPDETYMAGGPRHARPSYVRRAVAAGGALRSARSLLALVPDDRSAAARAEADAASAARSARAAAAR